MAAKTGLTACLLLCLCMPVASAQEAEAEDPEVAKIQRRIEELNREREELERKAEEARHAAEQANWFKEIQNEARERLEHIRAEAREREGDEGEGEVPSPAAKAFRDAIATHSRAITALCEKIVALKGPEFLPDALRMQRELEVAGRKWWLVDEPKHRGAVEVEEMTRLAAERDNPPELVALIQAVKDLQKRMFTEGEALFKLWNAHEERVQQTDAAVEDFWRKLDEAERREAELQLPD